MLIHILYLDINQVEIRKKIQEVHKYSKTLIIYLGYKKICISLVFNYYSSTKNTDKIRESGSILSHSNWMEVTLLIKFRQFPNFGQYIARFKWKICNNSCIKLLFFLFHLKAVVISKIFYPDQLLLVLNSSIAVLIQFACCFSPSGLISSQEFL